MTIKSYVFVCFVPSFMGKSKTHIFPICCFAGPSRGVTYEQK